VAPPCDWLLNHEGVDCGREVDGTPFWPEFSRVMYMEPCAARTGSPDPWLRLATEALEEPRLIGGSGVTAFPLSRLASRVVGAGVVGAAKVPGAVTGLSAGLVKGSAMRVDGAGAVATVRRGTESPWAVPGTTAGVDLP
jgi:hypothetical protein